MGLENSYPGVDEYAVRLIRFKARQLVGRAGFTESDREDLEQEMVIDLLRRIPKFDPARAKRETFITRIVEHKVCTLIEAQKAAMRDYRMRRASLHDEIDDEDGGRVERWQTLDQETYLQRTGVADRGEAEQRDLRIDLEAALADLPPALRHLCEKLARLTVTDVSHATGVPRSTLYDSMKQIRARFERAGLAAYAQRPPTAERRAR